MDHAWLVNETVFARLVLPVIKPVISLVSGRNFACTLTFADTSDCLGFEGLPVGRTQVRSVVVSNDSGMRTDVPFAVTYMNRPRGYPLHQPFGPSWRVHYC
jgi:hypothetical protein